MASFYNFFMYPLEKIGIRRARTILIKQVEGNVLELGSGTGANLPHYNFEKIEKLIVTDREKSKHLNHHIHPKVEFVEADVERLPFDSNVFDVVVHTLVFCSVSNVDKGLQEIKRVLKENGTLVFIEHVIPEKRGMRVLFQRINPFWKLLSKGCSLTKDFQSSLEENGFGIVRQGKFLNSVFYFGIAKVMV
jgi:ubiquinone/menaquinone biosynthesis C-methylase UbiE